MRYSLSTVVTPAGASLTMYREIRPYANSIWDDNNNTIKKHSEYRCTYNICGLRVPDYSNLVREKVNFNLGP